MNNRVAEGMREAYPNEDKIATLQLGIKLKSQKIEDLERQLNEARELLKAWCDTAMSGEQLLLEKATDKFLEEGAE